MPAPDYPWGLYIAGFTWSDRRVGAQKLSPVTAVGLCADRLDGPEQLAAIRDAERRCPHFVVTPAGTVLQCCPLRAAGKWIGPPSAPKWRDRNLVIILLDGGPDQGTWPQAQVLATARVLSVIWSQIGRVPVRDCNALARDAAAFPKLQHWPWLSMMQRTVRLIGPLDRIYAALESGIEIPEDEALPPGPCPLRLVDLDTA